jgi:hypothetical protein
MSSGGESAEWYVSRDGQQTGPMSRDDLQRLYAQGTVVGDDYLWSPELGDWKLASDVLPPPPPRKPPAPPRAAPQPAGNVAVQAKPGSVTANNFVKPKYDYELTEADDTLTFRIRTKSMLRSLLAIVIAAPLMAFAWMSTFMGLIYIASGGAPWFIGGLAAGYVAYLVFKFGNSKKQRPPVVFDRDGISVGSKRFAFSHISHIGYGGGSTPMSFVGGRAAATGAMIGAAVAESAGYYVYIVYGSERIPVVTGLDAQNVSVVYDNVCGFLRRFGHNFGG